MSKANPNIEASPQPANLPIAIPMSPDEQAIRNLLARWHAETAAGNVEAVLELMTEDVVFLIAGHEQPLRGRDAFAKGLRQMLQAHRFEGSGEVQDMAISGDLACCWSVLDVCTTPLQGGETQRRRGNVLSVLRKQADGRWQLARDANMLVLAEA